GGVYVGMRRLYVSVGDVRGHLLGSDLADRPATVDAIARSAITMMRALCGRLGVSLPDRKSTRLNSSHVEISYAVFCLKKKIVLSLKSPIPCGLFGCDTLFGEAVAVSGTRVLVGARHDSTVGWDVGNTYVFDLASLTPA